MVDSGGSGGTVGSVPSKHVAVGCISPGYTGIEENGTATACRGGGGSSSSIGDERRDATTGSQSERRDGSEDEIDKEGVEVRVS
ncbi:hypothetical protein WN55_05063 [Dufourea novaeangliae]|uniref:Uncharacterized protein n=1 Tax=Dufourea novaeangliae TaxID=178035 RepID=A0A154PNQ2_DUFNO|nr:hypothetical protein WN55_05063 [Dufourea novaeangliae]